MLWHGAHDWHTKMCTPEFLYLEEFIGHMEDGNVNNQNT